MNSIALPFRLKLAFGVGQSATGAMNISLALFLLFYYNQVLGLSGTLAGLAVGVSVLLDGVSDPLAHVDGGVELRRVRLLVQVADRAALRALAEQRAPFRVEIIGFFARYNVARCAPFFSVELISASDEGSPMVAGRRGRAACRQATAAVQPSEVTRTSPARSCRVAGARAGAGGTQGGTISGVDTRRHFTRGL